ncbi:MAG: lipid II flippase MurJ [Polyangiaceae bacterium]
MVGRRSPGAQSYFTWALRLCALPQGRFILALSSATLPSLASLAAAGKPGKVSTTYAHAMRLSLFISLGATGFLIALAHPFVVAVFKRGAFDASAMARAAARAVLPALVAGALGWWMAALVTVTDANSLQRLFPLAAGAAVFTLVFVLSAKLLRSEELTAVVAAVRPATVQPKPRRLDPPLRSR